MDFKSFSLNVGITRVYKNLSFCSVYGKRARTAEAKIQVAGVVTTFPCQL